MRRTILAVFSIAMLVGASSASAQICVLGIFVAAFQANAKEHRELTSEEAMTCGLTYMFKDDKQKKADEQKPKKKRVAHRAKTDESQK